MKTYEIPSTLIKKDHLIALIGDLYFDEHTDIQLLLDLAYDLKKEKPEVICLTGDFFRDVAQITTTKSYKPILQWLIVLSHIAPVCIVKGDQDCLEQDKYFNSQDIFAEVNSIPNVVVFNYPYSRVDIAEMTFTGFALEKQTPSYYLQDKESIVSYLKYVRPKINIIEANLDPKQYNVLLFHSPNALFNDYNHPKYSLYLTSHNLNGYVPSFIDDLTGNANWGFRNKQGKILAPHCRNGEKLREDASLWGFVAPCALPSQKLVRTKPNIQYINIQKKI